MDGAAASPECCPECVSEGAGRRPAVSPKGVLGGGLDAGFLSRDPVPGQPPRSGFSSGGACDTSVPGPALARSLQAAAGGGHAGLDDDELIGVLAGWAKTEAWAAAGRLAAAAELAARRPAGTRAAAAARAGKPAVWSRYCADELAVALSISRRSAERMIPLAHDLATRLPRTRQALAEGIIGDYKAQLIAEATRVLDDAAAADAEAAVVPGAVTGKTPGQIRAAIGRAVLKADPEAAAQTPPGRGERSPGGAVARGCRDRGDLRVRAAAGCGAGRRSGHHRRRAGPEGRRAARHHGPAPRPRLPRRPARHGLPPHPPQPPPRQAPGDAEPRHGGARRRRRARGGAEPAGAEPPPARSPPARRLAARRPGAEPGGAEARDTAARRCGGPRRGTRRPGSTRRRTGGAAAGGAAAGPDPGPARQAGPPRPAAAINLTIPLTTLLGLTDHPGEAAGYGPIDAGLARTLATQATGNPATTWCITITDQHGHPTAHGCATPSRPGKPAAHEKPPPAATRQPHRHRPGSGTGPPRAPAARHPAPAPAAPARHRRQPTRHRQRATGRRAARRVRDLAAAAARRRPRPDRPPRAPRRHRMRPPPRNGRARPRQDTPPPGPDPGRRMHLPAVPARRPPLRLRAHDPLGNRRPDLRLQHRAPLPPPPPRQASPRLDTAAKPARLPHLDHTRRAALHHRTHHLPHLTAPQLPWTDTADGRRCEQRTVAGEGQPHGDCRQWRTAEPVRRDGPIA